MTEPLMWVVLGSKDDGTWEIVLQTPFDELTFEAVEMLEGEDRRAVVVDTTGESIL